MDTISVKNLSCRIYQSTSDQIAYLLVPMQISDSTMMDLVQQSSATWVAVSGMDWDNDLTPWPAPNVPATLPPFAGHASEFLHTLLNDVLPAVEKDSHFSRRSLCGISLSGLFTLWAWMQTDAFDDMGSISGSFWYPNIVEWLNTHIQPKSGKAYFSLGVKEGSPKDPKAFQDVHQRTAQIIACLQEHRIECHFDATPGTHFAPPAPRLMLMSKYLY